MKDLFPLPERHDPGGRTRIPWPKGSSVAAKFGPQGVPIESAPYRYWLTEFWTVRRPFCMWVLMNPSTADIEFADPTLIKTGKFSRRWGYGGQIITNMHGYRATDSRRLLEVDDPIGPDNDAAIMHMARSAAVVVLAYGQPKGFPKARAATRAAQVVEMLRQAGASLRCLRLSVGGVPWHPLYLPDDTELREFPE